MQDLISTGKLRVGVVFAPAATAVFVTKDDDGGAPQGVVADLGAELAATLGVEPDFVLYPNSGDLTNAVATGAVDVGFMPVDDERRQRVDFGPSYVQIESTYMVRGDSHITSLADVDSPQVRVIGIANTTTIRSAARTAPSARVEAAATVDEAMRQLRAGEADAVALSRDAFVFLVPTLPGSRVLDGGFQQTGIAVAVAKNKPAALACVTDFVEKAKASGSVRRALDKVGLSDMPVAPAGA